VLFDNPEYWILGHFSSHAGAGLNKFYYSYERAIDSVARTTEWDIK
jgi:hypothetical protein